MKFIDKLKKSKRAKWVLFIVLALFVYSSFLAPEKKEASQETCSHYNLDEGSTCDFPSHINTLLGGDICIRQNILTQTPLQTDIDNCLGSDCLVGRHPESTIIIESPDTFGCFGCVPNGLRVQNPDDCCSKDATKLEYKDGYDHLCKALPSGVDPSTRICNSFEQAIADMVNGMGLNMGCKSAYYLTIFGGGFLLLIGIM